MYISIHNIVLTLYANNLDHRSTIVIQSIGNYSADEVNSNTGLSSFNNCAIKMRIWLCW